MTESTAPIGAAAAPQPLDDVSPGVGSLPPTATLRTDARVIDLSGQWRFRWSPSLIDAPTGIEHPDFDDSEWHW